MKFKGKGKLAWVGFGECYKRIGVVMVAKRARCNFADFFIKQLFFPVDEPQAMKVIKNE